MRGEADRQPVLIQVFQVEERIPADHPLRDIKRRADRILDTLHDTFEAAYRSTGRPSVPPERLLQALLLMGLYSVRSERQLCEQIDLNLLFRWFLDMQPSKDAFDATTLTKNRARLEKHGLTKAFFDAVVAEALAKDLCSEHFSVDGTLIESFASAKSFQPRDVATEPGKEPKSDDEGPKPDGNGFKPSNPDVDFHGQKRANETHRSQTDPEASLYRKGRGKEAKLSHMGHVLTENRNGLIITVVATEANSTAERTATLDMLDDLKANHQRVPATLGGDKGYDDGDFFVKLEGRKIEPHVPLVREPANPKAVKSKKRLPGIRARRRMKKRIGTEAYRLSQRCRKKLEECFGWLKVIAGMDRSRVVGRWKLRQLLEISGAAFNLVRLRRLAPVAG
ncbi:MAG TPA: IS5 family transposase [Gemmataceae bacterium]|nr:IS5 family transposase [Gemmataceae bacterium]